MKTPRGAPPHFLIDEDWFAQQSEPTIEPDVPIVDAHHHLWDRRPQGTRYLLSDLLIDIEKSGHRVTSTVFVESGSMYRAEGDPHKACIGQIEFANGMAAMSASGQYGPVRACAAIVGKVDLTEGASVEEVLRDCAERAPDRLRGIRQMAAWDASEQLARMAPDGLLEQAKFREGFSRLARFGLSFDAWVYHPQLAQVVSLADAFPNQPIIVNHMGGLVGMGPYATRKGENFAAWSALLHDLGQRPNVSVKVGGLGMRLGGHGFHDRPLPPTSVELAKAWRAAFEICISAFGPARTMFESNFPVDKAGVTYRVLWNAFKRLADSLSSTEKADLFSKTASRVYRLPEPPVKNFVSKEPT